MERDRIEVCAGQIVGDHAAVSVERHTLLNDLDKFMSDLTALRSAIAAVQF